MTLEHDGDAAPCRPELKVKVKLEQSDMLAGVDAAHPFPQTHRSLPIKGGGDGVLATTCLFGFVPQRASRSPGTGKRARLICVSLALEISAQA